MYTDGKKTVLLAEDEQPFRSSLLALLQKSGYNVIVAVDGLEALQKSRDYTGEIHLLLSDIQMPRMTGIELATQVCTERPETAILLVSGGAAGRLVINHGWQFQSKPFLFQSLRQRIKSMLNDTPKSDCDPSDFGIPAQ